MKRSSLFVAALLFLAFAAYGSIVPLQFRRMSIRDGWTFFSATPFVPLREVSRTDFASNILLFVPIGFFLLGAAAPGRRAGAIGWLVPVVAAAAAASVSIEFSQVFFSGRTPSWDDVVAQIIGACAGALVWIAIGPATTAWFAQAAGADSTHERLLRMLGAYVLLWVVLGLVPFDFTVRPQEIAEKFRAGRVVMRPFADHPGVETILSVFLRSVPLGAFALVLAVARRLNPAKLWALTIGIGVVGALELGQLMTVSRTASATDVVLGVAGVLAGIAVSAGATGERAGRSAAVRVRVWPVLLLLLWLVLIVARHWTPFDFRADGDFIRGRIPMFLQVPFSGYYWGNPLNAFGELTTKLLLGVPVGALLQAIYVPRTSAGRRWQAAGILTAAFCVFLVVELGQLLLPSRFPDQTDVYIGTAGACIGMVAVRLLFLRGSHS
jgi:glycopeptide antibiotics resistance protein